MTFDVDLSFNKGAWPAWIESQTPLFSASSLRRISERLTSEFHSGHKPGRAMPSLPVAAASSTLLSPLFERVSGYDLPCLITGPDSPRGYLMFCAQDPLRSGSDLGITVGTFFGIDNDRMRHSKRHYGVIWQLIRRCVEAGYGVWVTDAMKLWSKDMRMADDLWAVCADVLRSEVEMVRPEKIVAFGAWARSTLEKIGLGNSITAISHPTARHTKGWAKEGATKVYADSADGRFEANVDRYWRDIFGKPVLSCSKSIP